MNSSIGKISRLPHHIRETVHARLRDGEQGRQIVAWLNSLDEVKQVLAAAFGGRPVSEANLTQWKKRSHPSWLLWEDALAQAPRLLEQSRQVSEAGQGQITDHLATVVAASYALAAQSLGDQVDETHHWKFLRALCRDVASLRRGDHSAQWLVLQRLQLGGPLPSLPFPKANDAPGKSR